MSLTHSKQALIQKVKSLTFSINMATEEIKHYLKNADRPTTHYIWRTRGDGKVRSRHAKFNGKIFSWDNPPEGGYHPGEDYGCRCTAEPYEQERQSIKLYIRQTLVNAPTDAAHVWGLANYWHQYYRTNGKPVKLHEMGILNEIINKAKRDIYPKMEKLIFEKVQREGAGTYPFRWNDSYSFHLTEFVLGGATVTLNAILHVQDMGYTWKINGDLNYDFYDKFTDPLDIPNVIEEDYNPFVGIPFDITDEWSTSLEAVVFKSKVA